MKPWEVTVAESTGLLNRSLRAVSGAGAVDNARQAVERPHIVMASVELTLGRHREIDAIVLGLGEQAMKAGSTPSFVGQIFDLVDEGIISPQLARDYLHQLIERKCSEDELKSLLAPEIAEMAFTQARRQKSRAAHPAGSNRQPTVSSV